MGGRIPADGAALLARPGG